MDVKPAGVLAGRGPPQLLEDSVSQIDVAFVDSVDRAFGTKVCEDVVVVGARSDPVEVV